MRNISKKSEKALNDLYIESTRVENGEGGEVITSEVKYNIMVEVAKHYMKSTSMAYLHIDMAVFAYLVEVDSKVRNWEKYIEEYYSLEAFDRFRLGYVGRVLKSDQVFLGMVAEKGVMSELEADIAITNIVRNQDVDVNVRLKALSEFNKIKGRAHKGKRRAEEGLIKELEAFDSSGGILAIETDIDYDTAIRIYKAKEKREQREKEKEN